MAFWYANYSACVVYTKTIIRLSVGESDGYLPPPRCIIVKYNPRQTALPASPPEEVPGVPIPPVVGPGEREGGPGGGDGMLGPGPSPGAAVDKETQ